MHRKEELLGDQIEQAGIPSYAWEKKGTNLFTPKSITKYPEIRRTMFRIINKVREMDGAIFFYGREKIFNSTDLNSTGFYQTILAHAIRRINDYALSHRQNVVLVLDEHSMRRELLETASKTMFGSQPCKALASPPFEVKSYLNQNMQAADWIAAIIGRITAFSLAPHEFSHLEPYRAYFGDRILSLSSHSTIMNRPQPKREPAPDTTMALAITQALAEQVEGGAQVTVTTATVEITAKKAVTGSQEN